MLKTFNSTWKSDPASRSLLLAKNNVLELLISKKVTEVDLTEDDSNERFIIPPPKSEPSNSKSVTAFPPKPIMSHEDHCISTKRGQKTVIICVDCNVQLCPVCRKNFHGSLKNHFKCGTKKQCVTCFVYFPSDCALEAHSRLHEGYRGLLVCPDCGLVLDGIGSFIRHSLDVCLHLFRRSEFVCELCDYVSYESIYVYEQHIQNHVMHRYLCQLCSTMVDNRERMLEHFMADHSIFGDGLSGKFKMSLFCQICELSVTPHHWKVHKKNQRRILFQCSCSAKYRRRAEFEVHRSACPRSSTVPETWSNLMKITEVKKLPIVKTCDCKEFWQQDQLLLCKKCLKLSNKKQIASTTVQIADSTDWLGAEQIEAEEIVVEKEEEVEEEKVCRMDYSKIPKDHKYCLKIDLKFNVERCTANHDRTYFTIDKETTSSATDENTETPPPDPLPCVENPEPSEKEECCLICDMKIPLTPSAVFAHFRKNHGNHVLSFQDDDNIKAVEKKRKTVEPSQISVTSVSKTVKKKPDATLTVGLSQVSVTFVSKPAQKKPAETKAVMPAQVRITPVSKPVQKKPERRKAVEKQSASAEVVSDPAKRVLEVTLTKAAEPVVEPVVEPSTSREVEVRVPEKRQHEEMEPPVMDVVVYEKDKAIPDETNKVTKKKKKENNNEEILPSSSADGIAFWEKFNGAILIASSQTVPIEEKMKLLNEIQAPKRVSKKPKRLLDELDYLVTLESDDEEPEPSPESKKKKKRSKVSSGGNNGKADKPGENACRDLVPYLNAEAEQQDLSEPLDTENPYFCIFCKSVLADAEEYRAHLITHRTMDSRFQCMKCGDCFNTHFTLSNHLILKHKMVSEETAQYITDNNCAFDIKDIKLQVTDCSTSEVKQETETEKNQCKVCKDKFDNAADLNLHFRKHGLAFLTKK